MIMDFIQLLINNAVPIFIIVVVGFVLYTIFKVVTKNITKPISREEIERKNFIDRMKVNVNQSTSKYLYRGKDFIGIITHARNFITTGNPHNYLISEMVIKPTLFWKISNPLAKEKAFQVNLGQCDEKNMVVEPTVIESGDKMIVPKHISFNYYFGIYYDITIAREHQDIILQKDLALTDLHNEKSVDFAKAQELATIGYVPYAHEMGMKEKDIQHEIARKKGEQQSI
jgi:hypothetical protein